MLRVAFTISCLALSLCVPDAAMAAQETEPNKTIAQIAVASGNASVTVNSPSPSVACAFTLIQFNPATMAGRTLLAVLLEAESSNSNVDLVYDRNGSICTLLQVNSR